MKTKKTKNAAEPLFEGMPQEVRDLWTEHKAHKRAKDRAAFLQRQQQAKAVVK
jgi:hypothetical protein